MWQDALKSEEEEAAILKEVAREKLATEKMQQDARLLAKTK